MTEEEFVFNLFHCFTVFYFIIYGETVVFPDGEIFLLCALCYIYL